MFIKSTLLFVSSLLVLLVAVECQEQLTVESRQQKDNDELIDTIKYLDKLDKYFSQMARPRWVLITFFASFLLHFS